MDFTRPIQAIIPGVQGRILAVLAETSGELNLRTVAQLAGVSVAQASRVLPELVHLGIVQRREAPPSVLFHLVRDHVATRALLVLTAASDRLIDAMRDSAAELPVPPTGIIVFGSFARGDADEASDIDVVLVRPEHVEDEDEDWADSVERWRDAIRRISGNRVEVVEATSGRVAAGLATDNTLWQDIRRDGIVVTGPTLEELAQTTRA